MSCKNITGIIQNKKQKLYAIYCMPDHIHIFVSMGPELAISDLVRDVKANATSFINAKGGSKGISTGSVALVHFLTANHR